MASAAFTDAYVKYLTQFPDKASLGSGDPPDAWAAELAKQQPEAFDPVQARSLNVEGGNMAGVGNFDAINLVRALYAVRATRDPDYVNPYATEAPQPMAGVRIGTIVRMTGGC